MNDFWSRTDGVMGHPLLVLPRIVLISACFSFAMLHGGAAGLAVALGSVALLSLFITELVT